ncbi:hypothetical protein QTI66_29035 [Variovorax sp. J22R133]|uniref:hypothetical protein n=1 Tax=Variovorax brevis TaxID=3053503 RepID=UPI0025761326|nr:hypothetical protein [Variovorax sp. J22R133]MDM0116215.1 hypothetical protein [Variovorax sp. J22R133]
MMEEWEQEIWDNAEFADEPQYREGQLPGLVSDDGKERVCDTFADISLAARFYAEISGEPIDVIRANDKWSCARPAMPPLHVERLIAEERTRRSEEAQRRQERETALRALPREEDLDGILSGDMSLLKCATKEAAQVAAKFYSLSTGKPTQLWRHEDGWAVETHKPAPLTVGVQRHLMRLADEERRDRGELTEEERFESECEDEQRRVQEQWRIDRPGPFK